MYVTTLNNIDQGRRQPREKGKFNGIVKRRPMHLLLQFLVSFLLLVNLFKKDDAIQGFLEDLMLFVIKRLKLMRMLNQIGSKG